MSTMHQMIQTVENSGELTFTDTEWKNRPEAARELLLRGASQGYFDHNVDKTTLGEGSDAVEMERHTFVITQKGVDYMKKARGEA